MIEVPKVMIETAVSAADRAREITTRYFRAKFTIDTKQDDSPVTIADRETEALVRGIIEDRHPDHSFLGEETGDRTTGSPWRWVIDPIDGTKSFASGKPTFGTLIALLYEDQPVLGIIDQSALDERWLGVAGRESTFNGNPCLAGKTGRLADAILYATTPDMFSGSTL
ncbi:MAG: inositol monophosphatase family protein, partial [Pseudomonadota bacterium]|nr:inositol monophosphatase family protein [Pseudomonadota bacterium]